MAAAFKPQDFLIGARDFFAVIVPGATFLLLLPDASRAAMHLGTDGTELIGFAIAAYLAGSVFSAVGSILDFIVDPVLESRRLRAIGLRKLRSREEFADRLRQHLIRASRCSMTVDEHPETVKSFWWNHLLLNCPEAMVELDRIEATQKLFRTLTPVFLILAVLAFFPDLHPTLASGLGLTARYAVLFALISAGFYIAGRRYFLSSVYRLGAAYCLRERLGGNSAQE